MVSFVKEKIHSWQPHFVKLAVISAASSTVVAALSFGIVESLLFPYSKPVPVKTIQHDVHIKLPTSKKAIQKPLSPVAVIAQPDFPALEFSQQIQASHIDPGYFAFQTPTLILPDLTPAELNFLAVSRGPAHIRRAAPRYPKEAKRQRIEGTVYLEYDITKRGKTTNIRVLEAVPEGVFERAAIAAVRRWEYKPAVEAGRKVVTNNFRNRINFKLDVTQADYQPFRPDLNLGPPIVTDGW